MLSPLCLPPSKPLSEEIGKRIVVLCLFIYLLFYKSLIKIRLYRIPRAITDLFSGTTFRWEHKNKKMKISPSSIFETKYGVPQGFSLVPFIFNIYLNELGNLNLHSSIVQYADDTAFVLVSDKIEKLYPNISGPYKHLMNWYGNNYIFINGENIDLMCIRSPHKNCS